MPRQWYAWVNRILLTAAILAAFSATADADYEAIWIAGKPRFCSRHQTTCRYYAAETASCVHAAQAAWKIRYLYFRIYDGFGDTTRRNLLRKDFPTAVIDRILAYPRYADQEADADAVADSVMTECLADYLK